MLIKCTDYKDFCQENGTVFDTDNYIGIPPSGLVYVPLDRIGQFLKLCNTTKNKYVVVSALSDYGIEYQSRKSVSRDMLNWINFILDKVPDLRYEPLIIPPRCNIEECKISDTYSVKMYTYTKNTFDYIPENILWWFCTNLNVDIQNSTKIPFGCAEWTYQYLNRKYIIQQHKIDKLYVNFQTNTVERFALMRNLRNIDWCTVESGLSHEDYINRIRKHKWVFCPEGNGLDSYRITEALSVGSIPVMIRDNWNECYENLPIIFLDKLEDLCYNKLINSEVAELNYELISKEFWLNQIKQKLVEVNNDS